MKKLRALGNGAGGGDIAGYSSASNSILNSIWGWKYQNWNTGEPNNFILSYSPGGEDYAQIILSIKKWNDLTNEFQTTPDDPRYIKGFIVEVHNNE